MSTIRNRYFDYFKVFSDFKKREKHENGSPDRNVEKNETLTPQASTTTDFKLFCIVNGHLHR